MGVGGVWRLAFGVGGGGARARLSSARVTLPLTAGNTSKARNLSCNAWRIGALVFVTIPI